MHCSPRAIVSVQIWVRTVRPVSVTQAGKKNIFPVKIADKRSLPRYQYSVCAPPLGYPPCPWQRSLSQRWSPPSARRKPMSDPAKRRLVDIPAPHHGDASFRFHMQRT